MNVVVYDRTSGGEVCRAPVFEKGASATDNSLIMAGNAIVVENNYGYTGPTVTRTGTPTSPGVERIDYDIAAKRCTKVWHSDEISPTVVPKLSLANGLVYIYTKEPQDDGDDVWYLTALDFRTGRTVFKAFAGEGLGHNNNYAPITLGPDGSAYIGVLGGLVRVADATPPPGASPGAVRAAGGTSRPARRARASRGCRRSGPRRSGWSGSAPTSRRCGSTAARSARRSVRFCVSGGGKMAGGPRPQARRAARRLVRARPPLPRGRRGREDAQAASHVPPQAQARARRLRGRPHPARVFGVGGRKGCGSPSRARTPPARVSRCARRCGPRASARRAAASAPRSSDLPDAGGGGTLWRRDAFACRDARRNARPPRRGTRRVG